MFIAEREGFEPQEPLGSTVFKTAAIDHSAISPGAKVIRIFLFSKSFQVDFFLIFTPIFLLFLKLIVYICEGTNCILTK